MRKSVKHAKKGVSRNDLCRYRHECVCCRNHGICPLYNQEIINEYQDVLHRDKFHFPSESIDAIISTVQKYGISTERVTSFEYFPDPKDVVFYEVALSKDDAYLVTGNKKHFPQTPIVVTPAEMLEILQSL